MKCESISPDLHDLPSTRRTRSLLTSASITSPYLVAWVWFDDGSASICMNSVLHPCVSGYLPKRLHHPKISTLRFIKNHSKSTYFTRIQSVTSMHRKRCTSVFAGSVLVITWRSLWTSCRATPLGEPGWMVPHGVSSFLFRKPLNL